MASYNRPQPPADYSNGANKWQQRSYPAPTFTTKDHVAAALFAIFLGVFGLHKFYLGYNQAGFIMLAVSIAGSLLTFGLAAGVITVIAIIEGFIYLFKNQTEFERIYVQGHREWF